MVLDDGRVVAAVEGFEGLLQPGRFPPQLFGFLLQGQGGGAGRRHGDGSGGGVGVLGTEGRVRRRGGLMMMMMGS